MSEMKKILLAAVLGILVGIGAFFSPITLSQTGNRVLQSGAVPEAYVKEAVSQPVGDWFVWIGLLVGGIVGFGTFLFAKRRCRLT